MGKTYKTESFVFHLNQLCKVERGRVLRKVPDRRIFRFQFVNPLMQPYVVMKSLERGLFSDEFLKTFKERLNKG